MLRTAGTLVALALVLVPARARAGELGGRRDETPAGDEIRHFQLACDVCAGGWAVMENLSLTVDMLAFTTVPDAGVDSRTLLPAMAAVSATFIGFDAGLLVLSGQTRPFEDWLVLFAARTLAAMLTFVAANQLPQPAAIVVGLGLAAAASVPQFLLEPTSL